MLRNDPPTILCLVAWYAFLLPVKATSYSSVQIQVPGEQSIASKASQMTTVTIAEPIGNVASMWSPKRGVYIGWDSE
jgi:hypothetical protein